MSESYDKLAKISKIKSAVKNNFETSPDLYEKYENAYGFFGDLNRKLIAGFSFKEHPDILDIGCGTGASTRQISEDIPDAAVWGLDISPAMLQVGRKKYADAARIQFVEGDAARLPKFFNSKFDAIIYSASIFLIPDYHESLRQAAALLKPWGTLALTFMEGVYDSSNANMFDIADRSARQGVSLKKPVQLKELEVFFANLFPNHRIWKEDLKLPITQLREFFSIPAMSAGLFPGISYPERVKKVAALFDHLLSYEPLFRWVFMIGDQH